MSAVWSVARQQLRGSLRSTILLALVAGLLLLLVTSWRRRYAMSVWAAGRRSSGAVERFIAQADVADVAVNVCPARFDLEAAEGDPSPCYTYAPRRMSNGRCGRSGTWRRSACSTCLSARSARCSSSAASVAGKGLRAASRSKRSRPRRHRLRAIARPRRTAAPVAIAAARPATSANRIGAQQTADVPHTPPSSHQRPRRGGGTPSRAGSRPMRSARADSGPAGGRPAGGPGRRDEQTPMKGVKVRLAAPRRSTCGRPTRPMLSEPDARVGPGPESHTSPE